MRIVCMLGAVALALLLGATIVEAEVVEIGASKDNTLFESVEGALSNGAGDHLFVGRTAMGAVRRGLLAFDVAGVVPEGASIESVTLTLNMSQTIVGPQTIELHPASADWGEGTSHAGGQEGAGADATPGDATWLHTFFDADFWAMEGGDFGSASGSAVSDQTGPYTWESTPEMVADVQTWLDDASTNFGWVLTGDETTFPTAKRFDTRENPMPGTNPVLTVEFTTSVECEGDANGDGTVDPLDGGFVLARFGCPVGTGDPTCDAADQNGDGAVDPLDTGFVLARFGTCNAPPPPSTGACCNGVCTEETQADCEAAGGVYQGDGTTCDPDPCVGGVTEACCFLDGTCEDLEVLTCQDMGGGNQGDGTSCADGGCKGSACPPGADGDCCDPAGNGSPGCDDPVCCEAVCSIDPFCCDNQWDSICASEAAELCELCAP